MTWTEVGTPLAPLPTIAGINSAVALTASDFFANCTYLQGSASDITNNGDGSVDITVNTGGTTWVRAYYTLNNAISYPTWMESYTSARNVTPTYEFAAGIFMTNGAPSDQQIAPGYSTSASHTSWVTLSMCFQQSGGNVKSGTQRRILSAQNDNRPITAAYTSDWGASVRMVCADTSQAITAWDGQFDGGFQTQDGVYTRAGGSYERLNQNFSSLTQVHLFVEVKGVDASDSVVRMYSITGVYIDEPT